MIDLGSILNFFKNAKIEIESRKCGIVEQMFEIIDNEDTENLVDILNNFLISLSADNQILIGLEDIPAIFEYFANIFAKLHLLDSKPSHIVEDMANVFSQNYNCLSLKNLVQLFSALFYDGYYSPATAYFRHF
jgi:hypothetical protein